eukprot:TRINITY_DN9459_c0_g1_i5.p1 TRINITY_DN9459_c0_g1~~TRINITY_DN9459_c0_g1_i5.p1  ORF type:complete len:319 (-),score=88.40 TRINITY_DN9459_c0_g1_i5:221-1105(-)
MCIRDRYMGTILYSQMLNNRSNPFVRSGASTAKNATDGGRYTVWHNPAKELYPPPAPNKKKPFDDISHREPEGAYEVEVARPAHPHDAHPKYRDLIPNNKTAEILKEGFKKKGTFTIEPTAECNRAYDIGDVNKNLIGGRKAKLQTARGNISEIQRPNYVHIAQDHQKIEKKTVAVKNYFDSPNIKRVMLHDGPSNATQMISTQREALNSAANPSGSQVNYYRYTTEPAGGDDRSKSAMRLGGSTGNGGQASSATRPEGVELLKTAREWNKVHIPMSQRRNTHASVGRVGFYME